MPQVVGYAIAAIAMGASTTYSASAEKTAAKKATEAQERVSMAQIEAPIKAEELSAEAAKAKLKLRQASKSDTILTSPMGVGDETTTQKTLLGV